MIEVNLPHPPRGNWPGVVLEQHQMFGVTMWRVCVRGRSDGSASRNWFTTRQAALAFALDRADRRHLALFDLCGGEED